MTSRRRLMAFTTLLFGTTALRATSAFSQSSPCLPEKKFGAWSVSAGSAMGPQAVPLFELGAISSVNQPGVLDGKKFISRFEPSLNGRKDPDSKRPTMSLHLLFPFSRNAIAGGFRLQLSNGLEGSVELAGQQGEIVEIYFDVTEFLTAAARRSNGGRGKMAITQHGATLVTFDLDLSGFLDAMKYLEIADAEYAAGKAKNKNCCFITTACCEQIGLDDDCFELRSLRAFRDGPLLRLPGGHACIAQYYRNAPLILDQMRGRGELARLGALYWCYILPAAVAAFLGADRVARWLYTTMMKRLEADYLPKLAS